MNIGYLCLVWGDMWLGSTGYQVQVQSAHVKAFVVHSTVMYTVPRQIIGVLGSSSSSSNSNSSSVVE